MGPGVLFKLSPGDLNSCLSCAIQVLISNSATAMPLPSYSSYWSGHPSTWSDFLPSLWVCLITMVMPCNCWAVSDPGCLHQTWSWLVDWCSGFILDLPPQLKIWTLWIWLLPPGLPCLTCLGPDWWGPCPASCVFVLGSPSSKEQVGPTASSHYEDFSRCKKWHVELQVSIPLPGVE